MKNLIVLFIVVLCGCSLTAPSAPPSVNETSAARPQLSDRVKFIENYVTFRRSYDQLEYEIIYHNNAGSMVPGPSDWDIKILAIVPAKEIDDWIPADATRFDEPPPQWVKKLSGNIPVNGLTQWYRIGSLEIGVDRAQSTIAYRNTTIPD